MARKELPTDYIGDMSQLDMVLDAREVLARSNVSDAMWAANTALIIRYSGGAYHAEGKSPAVRVEGIALPTGQRDYRPADRTPSGTGGAKVATRPATSGPQPSQAQKDLYLKLVNDNLVDDDRTAAIAMLDTLTKTSISPIINTLLDMDKHRQKREATATRTGTDGRKTPEQLDAALPSVPDGRYRVADRNIKVDSPQRGQWAGRVFIVELDDEGHKLDRITRHTDKLHMLTAIAADPHAHALAFGKATGVCGRCDTPLEDPESIARGIGPYCEARSLGIPVSQVYSDRKQHPVATINQPPTPKTETPAARSESTPPAPTAPAPAPTTPAPAVDLSAFANITAADIDTLTFPQAMAYAKAFKVPGRGTARLPQLRDGIKAALGLAA